MGALGNLGAQQSTVVTTLGDGVAVIVPSGFFVAVNGEGFGGNAVHVYLPSLVVGDGEEQHLILGRGDGAGQRRSLTVGQLHPANSQGGDVFIQCLMVDAHQIHVAGGGGIAGQGYLHPIPHLQGAHIDDIGLVIGDGPAVDIVLVRLVGAIMLHRDILGGTAIHVGEIAARRIGHRLKHAAVLAEGDAGIADRTAVRDAGQFHGLIQGGVHPRQGGEQRLLTLKGVVLGALVVTDILRHRHTHRQSQLIAVDVIGDDLLAVDSRHAVQQGQLGMGGDLYVQNHVPQTQQRIGGRHVAVIQITVDAVDGVAHLAHKLGGEIGVAGGKGGQTAVMVQGGVHAGGAGQVLIAAEHAEGAPLLLRQLLGAAQSVVQHLMLHVGGVIDTAGEMLVLIHLSQGVGGAQQQLHAHQGQQQTVKHHGAVLPHRGGHQQKGVARQQNQIHVQQSGLDGGLFRQFRVGGGGESAHLLPQHQESRTACQTAENLLGGYGLNVAQRRGRHHQQYETQQEGETVRQVVGGVETVPQQVDLGQGTADRHHRQQGGIAQPTPQGNLLTAQVHGCQQHRRHAAIDVGQIAGADGGLGAVEQPSQQVDEGEIGVKLHHLSAGGGGASQRQSGGNQDAGRHTGAPQTACGKAGTADAHLLQGAALTQQPHTHIQHQEHAQHKADVVVTEQRQTKGGGIGDDVAGGEHILHRHHHQRQQHQHVQPHNIPGIGQHKAAQGVQ